MEIVLCEHGEPCILKTGLKPGPFLNKRIYMCAKSTNKCQFLEVSGLNLEQCPVHKATIALQVWQKNNIAYFCTSRPSNKFCGMFRSKRSKENKPISTLTMSTMSNVTRIASQSEKTIRTDSVVQASGTLSKVPKKLSRTCNSSINSSSESVDTSSGFAEGANSSKSLAGEERSTDSRDRSTKSVEGVDSSLESASSARHTSSPIENPDSSTYGVDSHASIQSLDRSAATANNNTSLKSVDGANSSFSPPTKDMNTSVKSLGSVCSSSQSAKIADDSSLYFSAQRNGNHLSSSNSTCSMTHGSPCLNSNASHNAIEGELPVYDHFSKLKIQDGQSLDSDPETYIAESEAHSESGSVGGTVRYSPALKQPSISCMDKSEHNTAFSQSEDEGSDSDNCIELDGDESIPSKRVLLTSSHDGSESLEGKMAYRNPIVLDEDSSDSDVECMSPPAHHSSVSPAMSGSSATHSSQSHAAANVSASDANMSDSMPVASSTPTECKSTATTNLHEGSAPITLDGPSEDESAGSDGEVVPKPSSTCSSASNASIYSTSSHSYSASRTHSIDASSSHDKTSFHSSTSGSPLYNKTTVGSLPATSAHSEQASFYSSTSTSSLDNKSTVCSNAGTSKKPVYVAEGSSDESGVDDDRDKFKVGHQTKTVLRQYAEIEHILQTQGPYLPDGGAQLRKQKELLKKRLDHLKVSGPKVLSHAETTQILQKNIVAQSRGLTVGAIGNLHSSLENCPTEDTLAEDPPGLSVPLMTHQKRALAWMQWREEQTPAAGILADDMGLGKTLSMLSLMLTKRGSREERKEWTRDPHPKRLVKSPATLVVCPASLIHPWAEEAHTKLGSQVSVYVYHGKNITTYPYDLVNYDLVITTYTIVGDEGSSCPSDEPESEKPMKKKRTVSHTTLFQIHWMRVILDEAHTIRNPSSALSMGACKLSADYRWAVTGTPIQNKLKDFYSLIKFVHLAPFDDIRVWKEMVEKKGTRGMERLNTMVSALVLRRTKEELGSGLLQLTKKIVNQHDVELNDKEMEIYRYIYTEARKVMAVYLEEKGEHVRVNPHNEPDSASVVTLPHDVGQIVNHLMKRGATSATGKGSCVLWMLLRLRQCCCHMKLLVNNLDDSESVSREDVDLDLRFGALSLDHPTMEPIDLSDLPAIFRQEAVSTKIAQVVKEIRRITSIPDDPPQKCVVVSQWTHMLDIIESQLAIAGVYCTRIDGKVSPGERLNRVKMLNSRNKNPSVMLLSLQAGGVGLNLIGANHLFMTDMHWNPALEQQAADRCHRVGQQRDVHIHKFVCTGTIEERILQLQSQKLQLASNVMTGASQKSRKVASKLSLNDLKNLFELS